MGFHKMQKKLEALLAKYKGKSYKLLEILYTIQKKDGFLSVESMKKIANFLNISYAHVYCVATFYPQIELTLKGKYHIEVCNGTACHVRGAQEVLNALEKKLGCKPGMCTKDKKYHLLLLCQTLPK